MGIGGGSVSKQSVTYGWIGDVDRWIGAEIDRSVNMSKDVCVWMDGVSE